MIPSPLRSPLRHRITHVNGVHLHIVESGDDSAPPVILLHGFPEFWYGWRNQVDALVDAGFRVVMPDQRGYNLSAKPEGAHAYTLDALAADVIGIMDDLGATKTPIIGHDWGGGVAWWLANKFPERVEKLTVLNVPHHNVFTQAVKHNPKQRRRSAYMAFFQLDHIAEAVCAFGNYRVLAGVFAGNPAFTAEDIRAYKAAWQQPGALTAMLNWYRAAQRHRVVPAESQRITVPTLLIWGMKDPAFIPELAAQSIAQCDDGRMERIPNASHWVQHEAAAQVNRLLVEWLG